MKIFFSVGEASGDLHAANLIKQIKKQVPQLQAVGFGGPKMAASGCELLFDLTQLAVMFLSGAVRNLRKFFKLIADADRYFADNKVDAVVLIDYPGFNWWIARKAKKHGIPVFYYGVPQMWAWAPWRIKKIRKFVDFVICKLPFEPKWFRDRGCEAFYVGHPYFDELNSLHCDREFVRQQAGNSEQTVLLLPGSRNLELERNLSTLLSVAEKVQNSRPGVRMVMGCLNDAHQELATEQRDKADIQCEIFSGRTQDLMMASDACVACSGSVSLELLHHRLPTVIVYKPSLFVMLVQTFALKCKFITLPNLMNTDNIRKTTWWPYDPDAPNAESTLMPEYLSWSDCSEKVSRRLLKWLDSEESRAANVRQLDELARQYAIPGATGRAAEYILSRLQVSEQVSNSAA